MRTIPIRLQTSYLLALAWLASLAPLPAQSPEAEPAPAPAIATATAPATEAVGETEIGTLILSDDSAIQVIELYEQLTGKIVLRRQDIPAVKINFNSRGPISQSEAILAIESLLSLNGVMLSDVGGRFIKAVPASNVNQSTPSMLEGSTLDLPPSQQIYTKFFRLEYLKADESRDDIVAPLLSNQSHLVAFTKANALLVSDSLLNLQRVESMLNSLDQPQKFLEKIEFIKLNFIQAQDMQRQLEELIKGPLQRYLEGNTSITADERSNQIIVVTHPGNLDTIKEVVDSIDVDAAPLTRSEVFQLRQAKAEEVVPIIENIISGQEEGRQEDAKVARNQNNQNNQNKNNNNNNKNAPNAAQARAASKVTNEANSALQFSNFVGLSPDTRTNSIVAYGTDSDLKSIAELIDKIDIPLPQVRIEAIITEVSLDENQGSGLQTFNLQYSDGITQLTGDLGKIASGSTLLDTDGNPLTNLTSWNGGKFTLDAVLDLAEGDNQIKILSTPSIVVSHNEEGVINVSQSRPFETGSTTYNNNPNTQTQIEYRDVGIKLTATPLIGADGSVQLQIEQTIDTVQEVSKSTNDSGDIDTRPVIGKREANSTVTVNDGDVIILGGLQENKKDVSNTYFPLIGRLPVFKELLSNESVDYTRTELIIFIRPTILKSPSEASAMTKKAMDLLEESEAVKEYLETGTTGDTYMEGSGFEDEKPPKPVKSGLPRFR